VNITARDGNTGRAGEICLMLSGIADPGRSLRHPSPTETNSTSPGMTGSLSSCLDPDDDRPTMARRVCAEQARADCRRRDSRRCLALAGAGKNK
jgi:hypothetical protein